MLDEEIQKKLAIKSKHDLLLEKHTDLVKQQGNNTVLRQQVNETQQQVQVLEKKLKTAATEKVTLVKQKDEAEKKAVEQKIIAVKMAKKVMIARAKTLEMIRKKDFEIKTAKADVYKKILKQIKENKKNKKEADSKPVITKKKYPFDLNSAVNEGLIKGDFPKLDQMSPPVGEKTKKEMVTAKKLAEVIAAAQRVMNEANAIGK